MKKILSAALAVSLIAGAASAAPYDGRGDRDRNNNNRYEQPQRPQAQKAQAQKAQAKAQAKYERRAAKRYRAAAYKRPPGYQARHWRHGERLPANYRSRAYAVDAHRYGLPAAPRGYQYTRVDNDVVLTAVATGVIASVIIGLFQ